MPNPTLTPREAKRLDEKREDHRENQPYASELADRELESAHKDGRPVDPKGDAAAKPKS